MYELRTDIKRIQTKRENIVAIIESINQPMVAAMGRSAERAKAHIVGVRNPSGTFSIYVYLFLVDAKEALIYLHDPAEIKMEAYHDTELVALGFVESMGFMVDNLNFRAMQPQQQVDLLASLPCFHEDLTAWAKTQAVAEPAEGELEVEESDIVDLSPLEDDVLELEEVAEEVTAPGPAAKVVSPEGLAKIIRMFSSF